MRMRPYVVTALAAAAVFAVAGYAFFHSLPVALAEGAGVGLAVLLVGRLLLAARGPRHRG